MGVGSLTRMRIYKLRSAALQQVGNVLRYGRPIPTSAARRDHDMPWGAVDR